MDILFWLVILTWMAKTGATDVIYSLKGETPPRHRERMARLGAGKTTPTQYGFRSYFADLKEDALRASTNSRREKIAQRAKEKLAAVDDMIDVVQERPKRPDGWKPSPTPRPTPPAPKLETVPEAERTPASPPTAGPPAADSSRVNGAKPTTAGGPASNGATPTQPAPRPGPSAQAGRPRIPPGFTPEQWAAEIRPVGGNGKPEPERPVDWKAEAAATARRRNDPANTAWHETYRAAVEMFGHGPVCEYCNQAIELSKDRTRYVCWCTKSAPAAAPSNPAPTASTPAPPTLRVVPNDPPPAGTAPAGTNTEPEGDAMASGETTHINATRAFVNELDEHVKKEILPQLEKCAATLTARGMDPAVVAEFAAVRERFMSATAALTKALDTHDHTQKLMEEGVNNTANPADVDYYKHR
jgi:hypothetical protein